MERALVIGAGGLLGRETVQALRRRGVETLETGRDPLTDGIRFDAEVDAPDEVLSAGVGLVVNCAGVLAAEIDKSDEATVRRAEAINARFPHVLATAAARRGSRLVHISTDAVFRADAGRCFEDDERFASDVYGDTKRRGEPLDKNAISLRCSFVGRDPKRRQGLVEWLLAQPAGATVEGYVDQAWNGLASSQVAAVCAALADPEVFARARAEGPVHHLFEDPPLSKHELVELCVRVLELPLIVVPQASARPSTRILGSRHATLVERLQSVPPRARMLAALSERGHDADG